MKRMPGIPGESSEPPGTPERNRTLDSTKPIWNKFRRTFLIGYDFLRCCMLLGPENKNPHLGPPRDSSVVPEEAMQLPRDVAEIRNYIMELYYGIMLWNHITESSL